ncbi:hypothetical protein ACIPJ2_08315 [Curtobacterium sp. NPDC090217]|uniref:hypothetical protein n=1 Tax=Curtobacterium sp. NPDC090217 TaxID=3363970 RepID=UPI0037F74422
MQQSPPRAEKSLRWIMAAVLLVGGLTVGVGGSFATAAPAAAATPEPEAPDYASEVFGDPWDYAGVEDQNTDTTGRGAVGVAVSGGALRVALGGRDWVSMIDTTTGSLPYGRDGAINPVNTGRYSGLSFQMDQPYSNKLAAVYWYTCREKTAACGGGFTVPVVAGPHLYDLDLTKQSVLLGKVPWRGSAIVSLRIDPVLFPDEAGLTGSTAAIDWMRLHAPADSTHPHAALPPGTQSGVTIDPLPRVVVDSPSPADGTDLATAQRGRSWDFTSAANAAGITTADLSVSSYDARGMNARNTGPDIGDPKIMLPVSSFSGATYRYLSFDMTYDGPFGLADAPGGGKVARLIWNVAGTGTPQIGNDVLTYSGPNARTVSIDLAARDPLDEAALAPRAGWYGQTVTGLRFDPNEDPSAASWHLAGIHLRATPAATETSTVRFHDAAWVPGTTAEVRVGTGAPGSPGYTTIASGVSVAQGDNSVPFTLGSLPAGTYNVEVLVRHPSGTAALAYSTAPITMRHDAQRDPVGSFDSAGGSTSGVTMTGWAYDPDATGPTTVALYDQTRGAVPIGTVSTSVPRSDVRRVHPNAPQNSGWTVTKALSAGQHTICAYGINVGAGSQNTTLGCRTFTVAVDRSHDPIGSLDAVSAVGSTVTATGWVWDPDASGPTQVQVYDQTSGARSLGVATASSARPDVQRAHPSAPIATGWTFSTTLSAGTRTLCAYGLNQGAGSQNTTIGCSTVTVR